jgi:hypothetical protein
MISTRRASGRAKNLATSSNNIDLSSINKPLY